MLSAAQSSFTAAWNDQDEPETSPLLDVRGKLGTVTMSGPMMRRRGLFARIFFGATDTSEILRAVEEARAHPEVSTVLLDIDSPGGSVNGTPELAQAVRDLAERKHVYAFTEGQMCSAAYWIASQCDGIYMTPSARVGSIGVIMALRDTSEAFGQMGVKVEKVPDWRF
jgi:ClpP class serine protease